MSASAWAQIYINRSSDEIIEIVTEIVIEIPFVCCSLSATLELLGASIKLFIYPSMVAIAAPVF